VRNSAVHLTVLRVTTSCPTLQKKKCKCSGSEWIID